MSVTSEDQEAQDVVHFPDSRDDNHISPNRVSSSSSSPHTDSHSHCSHSEDSNEDDYSSDYSSSDDGGNHHPQQLPFSQHTFAPPFYGRPPTPLPPSPSLTSLLRPSRPTTPDASDDEGNSTTGGGNGGSSHNSRLAAQGSDPVPRASPKVPTYEYYGFVLYLFSTFSFLIYLLWSYLPSPFLHAIGVYYYPNRWWSVAIPSFLVMALVYIYVALALYNTEYLTLSFGSVETVVDEAANVAVVDSKGRLRKGGDGPVKWTGNGSGKVHGHGHGKEKGKKVNKGKAHGGGGMNAGREKRRTAVERERERERRKDVLFPDGTLNWREVWNEGTDAVMDVPLGGVCEVLYGELRDGGDLEEDEYEVDESEIITRL